MLNIVPDVNVRKEVEEQDLGFILVKFFFISMVQKINRTQCFLEAGEKGLRRHGLRLLFATKNVARRQSPAATGRPAEAA